MSGRAWLLVQALTVAAAALLIFKIGDGGGVFRFADAPARHSAPSPAGAVFPRTFTDFHGFQLRLEKAPAQIASQSLATDELLLAIVAPERVAAVSLYADRPQYSNIVEPVRRHGIPLIHDPEWVIRLQPDLLLASNISRAAFIDLVRNGGVPTYTMRTIFRSLDEIEDGLLRIGDLTGEPQAAALAAAEFESAIEAAAAKRPSGGQQAPLRVLALSAFLYSYGKGSLFEDIVTRLGAVNVGSEQGLGDTGKVGNEQIAVWNPDWIVSGTGGDDPAKVLESLMANPAIAVTTAGRSRQILVVQDRRYLTTSHYVTYLMDAIAEALYGSQ